MSSGGSADPPVPHSSVIPTGPAGPVFLCLGFGRLEQVMLCLEHSPPRCFRVLCGIWVWNGAWNEITALWIRVSMCRFGNWSDGPLAMGRPSSIYL